jgi:hypothetical protein
MRSTSGWPVILVPFAVIFVLLSLYVIAGRVDQSVLPHGEAEKTEKQTPYRLGTKFTARLLRQ